MKWFIPFNMFMLWVIKIHWHRGQKLGLQILVMSFSTKIVKAVVCNYSLIIFAKIFIMI